MKRKTFLSVAVSAVLCAASVAAFAQAYPTRPITMLIPFPPGGTLDTVGRALAQKMGQQLGQTIVVENRGGGAGTIGASLVKQAKADGYTLLFAPSTHVSTPLTMKTPPYDSIKDFTPIALVAKAPLAIAINKNLPITDVKSLIAYAKAHPGKLTFAIGSTGSAGHLSTELLRRSSGIEVLIVPYKGSAPAYTDLIGGQIDGFIDPILGSASFAKSGLLRQIAVTSKARVPNLPGVPTVAETVPGYEFYSWYGLWGPANLPKEVAERLNAEVNKALSTELRPTLAEQGILVTPGSIDDFVRFQKEEVVRSGKIITEGNIRAE